MKWSVYILRCADNSLYTGCTNNLEERLKKHNAGQGAKYTRSRLPVSLVYAEKSTDRSAASIREAEIKKYSRQQKEQLVSASADAPEAMVYTTQNT